MLINMCDPKVAITQRDLQEVGRRRFAFHGKICRMPLIKKVCFAICLLFRERLKAITVESGQAGIASADPDVAVGVLAYAPNAVAI